MSRNTVQTILVVIIWALLVSSTWWMPFFNITSR